MGRDGADWGRFSHQVVAVVAFVCMFPTQKEENRKLAAKNVFLCKSIEILRF